MLDSAIDIISPDWPAPAEVVACCTTRRGGVSEGAYTSLNLAHHVDDVPERVAANRTRLRDQLGLPSEPQWLAQTHSIDVVDLDNSDLREADAAVTRSAGTIAVVMTADCLPVLFCNRDGTEVAAVHAGWRGLVNGVLEATVMRMHSEAPQLLAWLGPAIGPQHFEVGEEVRSAFTAQHAEDDAAFSVNRPGHYLADLYSLARARLNRLGVGHICGGEYCTFADRERFFSYRREARTGRQASLIYIR
jgi:YfiH family protein